jgi:electron transfer flavoprotein beta subunit
MAYKNAKTLTDLEKLAEGNSLLYIDQLVHEYETKNLYIKTLTFDDLGLEAERCGVKGSPTKVHEIDSVVLSGSGSIKVEPTRDGLGGLIDSLMQDHILG